MDYTIPDTPDSAASRDTLREHYKKVNNFFATHGIDTFLYLCHWCLADDAQYRSKLAGRGIPKYCSERCRDAAAAYFTGQTSTGPRVRKGGIQC